MHTIKQVPTGAECQDTLNAADMEKWMDSGYSVEKAFYAVYGREPIHPIQGRSSSSKATDPAKHRSKKQMVVASFPHRPMAEKADKKKEKCKD